MTIHSSIPGSILVFTYGPNTAIILINNNNNKMPSLDVKSLDYPYLKLVFVCDRNNF